MPEDGAGKPLGAGVGLHVATDHAEPAANADALRGAGPRGPNIKETNAGRQSECE